MLIRPPDNRRIAPSGTLLVLKGQPLQRCGTSALKADRRQYQSGCKTNERANWRCGSSLTRPSMPAQQHAFCLQSKQAMKTSCRDRKTKKKQQHQNKRRMQQYGIKNHNNDDNIKGSWARGVVAALLLSVFLSAAAVPAGCSQDQYPQLSEACI